GLRRAGVALEGRLEGWNPFGRVVAAVGALVLLGIPIVGALLHFMPALRDVMPWRIVFAGIVYLLACGFGARWLVRRGGLLPRAPLKRRRVKLIAWAAGLIIFPATLVWWGADPEAKYVAGSASPPLPPLVHLVRG